MTDYYSNLKDTNKSQIQSMNTDEILQVSAYEELLKQLGKTVHLDSRYYYGN